MTSKLTALVEAAKADCIAKEGNYGELCGYGDDILELCNLLEKAEEALNQSIIVRERRMRWRRNAWPSTDQETIVSDEFPLMDKALAAIKQWKEQT